MINNIIPQSVYQGGVSIHCLTGFKLHVASLLLIAFSLSGWVSAVDEVELNYSEVDPAYSKHPVFDITQKAVNKSVLDYIKELGLWNKGSIFELGEMIASGADVDTSEMEPDQVLRYSIQPASLYFDRYAGVVSETRKSDRDIEILVYDLVPELYPFSFRQMRFGNESEGSVLTSIGEIDYIIGTTDEFEYWKPSNSVDHKDNPTGDIVDSVFSGLTQNSAGSAILNKNNGENLNSVRADFFDCHMTGGGGGGGAISIWDKNKINGGIYGTFMNNSSNKEGGAIWSYNQNYVSVIDGDFIGNKAGSETHTSGTVRGGAIYNYQRSQIGTITGHFIGNMVIGTGRVGNGDGCLAGGAISNAAGSYIDLIVADFVGNAVFDTGFPGYDIPGRENNADGHGGAIYNGGSDATIKHIIGDFYGNKVDTFYFYKADKAGEEIDIAQAPAHNEARGGAICNIGWSSEQVDAFNKQSAYIETIQGAFVRNYVRAKSQATGGAIYNNRGAIIDLIEANFVRNHAISVTNQKDTNIDDFATAHASGGAIANYHKSDTEYNSSTIKEIKGNFYGNYAQADGSVAQGGAISNHTDGSFIDTIDGHFIDNYAESRQNVARGGAVYTENKSIINKIRGSFYNNHTLSAEDEARGGAISNGGSLDSIINAVFVGNYAKGRIAHGGAIYNRGTLNIIAEKGGVSYFNNNFIIQTNEQEEEISRSDEAIYADKGSKITLIAREKGAIVFEDIINGVDYDLILQGDSDSHVLFNNKVLDARITMYDVNLDLDAGIDEDKLRGARESFLNNTEYYTYSDVLRTSRLDVRSGQVMLEDGYITEYLFDEIKAYGKNYPYAGPRSADAEKGDDAARNPESDYASFTIDVNLDHAVGDIITAFANEKKGIKSEGRVTLSDMYVMAPENWEHMELQFGTPITVQVINYVEYDEDGSPIIDADFYNKYKEDESFIIQLDEVGKIVWEKSKMRSSQILPDGMDLDTTKTYHDSLQFISIRDNLAAWAEMDDTGKWVETDAVRSPQYDDYEESDKHKIFTVEKGRQKLTRNIKNLKSGEESGAVWGEKWTIRGVNLTDSILDLNQQNMLTVVPKEQTGFLQRLTLRNVKGQRLENNGSLTLDTILTENELVVHNRSELIITGLMDINNTITSDTPAEDYTMVIDDSSQVMREQVEAEPDDEKDADKPMPLSEEPEHGYAYVNITGTVENQNIIHKGSGSYNRVGAQTDYDYSTVSNLIITEADGKPSDAFKNFTNNSLNMQGGLFNLYNLGSEKLHLRRLEVNGGSIHVINPVHVNLAEKKMGRIYADSYGQYDPADNGHIFVDSLKLIKSSFDDEVFVKFADSEIAASVVPFADEEIGQTKGESSIHYMWDPIILWHVTYDYEEGYYIFRKYPIAETPEIQEPGDEEQEPGDEEQGDEEQEPGDEEQEPGDEEQGDEEQEPGDEEQEPGDEEQGDEEQEPGDEEQEPGDEEQGDEEQESGDEEQGDEEQEPDPEDPKKPDLPPGGTLHFNPAIVAGAVEEQMGGYGSMQSVYNNSFSHAEFFSASLNNARKARLYERAHSVITPVKGGKNAVRHKLNRPKPAENMPGFKGGMWVRPYSSTERVPLYDGMKAQVSLYGALVGGDSSLTEYQNGWASVFSVLAGYIGATQKYSSLGSGVRTTQNGGVVGVTETFYYRNFYTAVTATIGTASAHATTMYGGENFHMYMGGVASRSGYNIELGSGRYVLQPTLQLSYTCINMPTYTNAAGMRVMSDAMHAIQIHPYLKAILRTESGWDPFVTIGCVKDFMGRTSYRTENYKLPSIGVDPYVEYSLGAQKTWFDKYTFFWQVIGRNGGRNGVEVNAGLRWGW